MVSTYIFSMIGPVLRIHEILVRIRILGSADPFLWPMDPDSDPDAEPDSEPDAIPDPVIFVSDL
jgi:hypothetical protein